MWVSGMELRSSSLAASSFTTEPRRIFLMIMFKTYDSAFIYIFLILKKDWIKRVSDLLKNRHGNNYSFTSEKLQECGSPTTPFGLTSSSCFTMNHATWFNFFTQVSGIYTDSFEKGRHSSDIPRFVLRGNCEELWFF